MSTKCATLLLKFSATRLRFASPYRHLIAFMTATLHKKRIALTKKREKKKETQEKSNNECDILPDTARFVHSRNYESFSHPFSQRDNKGRQCILVSANARSGCWSINDANGSFACEKFRTGHARWCRVESGGNFSSTERDSALSAFDMDCSDGYNGELLCYQANSFPNVQ